MAKSLGDNFEQVADRLVSPNLLKLALNGNKVMAEAGHKAILIILQHVNSDKLLLRIINEITTKNPVLRSKCSIYLRSILSNYPIEIVEKHTEHLENGLRIGLTDASAETRSVARESFVLYESLFPNRATKLYEKLSLPLQRAICETREQYEIPKERMFKKVSSYDDTQTSIEQESLKEVKTGVKKRSVYDVRPKKIMSLMLNKGHLSTSEKSTKSEIQVYNQNTKSSIRKPSIDTSPSDDVDEILEGMKSEEPEKKIMAMEDTICIIDQNKLTKAEDLKELITLLISNITNVNNKISQLALTAIKTTINTYTKALSPFIEELSPKIVYTMLSNREVTASLSKEILQLLVSSYGADNLVFGFTKCIDSGNAVKVKLGGLNILNMLIDNSNTFCNNKTNTKSLVQKIGQVIKDNYKDKKMMSAALTILLKLKEKNYEATISSILSLPESYTNKIKELARENGNDLNLNISFYGTSKTKLKAESPKRSPIKVSIIGNTVEVNEEVKEMPIKRSLSRSPLKSRGARKLIDTPPKSTKYPLDSLLIVDKTYTPEEINMTLNEISKALEVNSVDFPWKKLLQPMLCFIFNNAIFELSGEYQSYAFNLLKRLTRLKTSIVLPHLNELLEHIARCYILPKKIHVMINPISELIGTKFTHSKIIRLLSTMIITKKPPLLQACIRCLSVIVSTSQAHEIPIKILTQPLFIVNQLIRNRL